MIIVSYVYKKPIIIIEHRYEHKFQICKEDGFTNLKFDYTWQHDSFTKLGFAKIRKSKTCYFWKIKQITPYFISSNDKLSMVAFDNTL